jgi:NADPH-dependent glutamate synthase beta subunit-like oxidoreductase/NAD(P)H-flavin reductase
MNSLNIFSKNSTIKFPDLYHRSGLIKLDLIFNDFFQKKDPILFNKFQNLKNSPENFSKKDHSDFLIGASKILASFLVEIFAIEKENQSLKNTHHYLDVIYKIKRSFVQKEISKKYNSDQAASINGLELLEKINPDLLKKNVNDLELALADLIDKNSDTIQLENLRLYSAFALYNDVGKKLHENGILFKLPKKINPENLVKLKTRSEKGIEINGLNDEEVKSRQGFKLTDSGMGLNKILGEANYCIYCHNQNKDSCSIGLKEKNGDFKIDQFGVELSGCPLEEKISEMNFLKGQGEDIAALSVSIIDNPMVAATGHRICNDCMKSCIYQKQEPVDIPQIETNILKNVLHLPYGFEIYSLLTRWNPLNLNRSIPKENSGYKILVAGLGPAGFTLAHHLLNEGHLVVGIDGLKIEPLDQEISGTNLFGERSYFKPIRNIKEIYEELDERVMHGFGGVAEYGITARWDKNYLKIVRLLLERRENFRMFGGFRLGSALDCSDAFEEYNFDHIALCLGAGRPNIINIKNNFAKGIRSASDFLMALQLTGAANKNLLTNLQVRLPITVIGAGLTAIDTACEALAYYVSQVENFKNRYEILCQNSDKKTVEKNWNEEDKIIAEEFLEHANLIKKAKENGENISLLLKKLGGAKIIYRQQISASPAYKSNHQELEKALEEGIEFIFEATPSEAILDEFNHIKSLKINYRGEEKELSAKTLFFAAGTSPNKSPAYEDKLEFILDKNTFQIIDLSGNKLPAQNSCKANEVGFMATMNENKKFVSFFGDLHPSFGGSVVKAMASAKRGYPIINLALDNLKKSPEKNYKKFLKQINNDFTVQVKSVNILSENIFELTVYAPLLARKTKLGHIFRLHNYHNFASRKKDTLLAMEGVAVTAYKIDTDKGLISVMVINTGGSSSLVKNFKVGEPLIFMGPSGTPTHMVQNKNVMLIAGGRGIFPLAAIGAEYKKNNCQVIFFCGFKNEQDLVKQKELEQACDVLILAFEEKASKIKLTRKNDIIFHGQVTDAVVSCANSDYKKIDLIYTMGNEQMMDKISRLRNSDLKNYLNPDHIGIGNLSNPMQCMMKGICSQCLQAKKDEKTGEIKYFYSCINPDQKLNEVDFDFLKNRCGQNSLPEKLTKEWIEYVQST